jgi:hypothetical protein
MSGMNGTAFFERVAGWYVVGAIGLVVVLAGDVIRRRRIVSRFREQLESEP